MSLESRAQSCVCFIFNLRSSHNHMADAGGTLQQVTLYEEHKTKLYCYESEKLLSMALSLH